jgi:hypothetical protein
VSNETRADIVRIIHGPRAVNCKNTRPSIPGGKRKTSEEQKLCALGATAGGGALTVRLAPADVRLSSSGHRLAARISDGS